MGEGSGAPGRQGTLKTTTVSNNACGHYFATILTDSGLPEAKAITHFERSRIIGIGIDMGIKDVVINSRGESPVIHDS
jgi:hypothetical protein